MLLDYLRQRGLEEWPPNHPVLMRFKAHRCATLADVQAWIKDERKLARTCPSVPVRGRPCKSMPPGGSPRPPVPTSAQLAANAALSLLNLTRDLLKNQLKAQAAAFETEGGFTERLYRLRSQRRKRP